MLEINFRNIFLVVATSALLTIWVNEIVYSEPEELQEFDKEIKFDMNEFLSGANNLSDINFGQQMTSSTKTQNSTLYYPPTEQAITKYPSFNENITRILQLQLNFTLNDDDDEDNSYSLQELIDNNYYIETKIKSDRYTDYKKFTFEDLVYNKNRVPIIIENNATNRDDGGDFRIDVWINNFDDHFVKATYPIKRNATFDSVDITELIQNAWEDNEEEGNNIENADDIHSIDEDINNNNNNGNNENNEA